jgi:hypothetical protein
MLKLIIVWLALQIPLGALIGTFFEEAWHNHDADLRPDLR